jgi:hypothetical protein
MKLPEKTIQTVRKDKFYLLFCFIGLFSGLVSVYYTDNVKLAFSGIAVSILVLLTLFALFHKIKTGNLTLFEPFTLAFLGILIYFILPAIDLIFLGKLIGPSIKLSHYKALTAEDDRFLATIIFLCTLGVISFYFGYVSTLGRKIGCTLPVPGHLYSKNLLLKTGIFYALLGIIAFGYAMWKVGGAAKWFTTPKGANIFLVAKCVYGTFLLKILIPAIIILFAYALLRGSKIIFVLWTGAFLATAIFFTIFSQGSRRIILFLVLSLIIYYRYAVRPLRFKQIALIIAVLFFYNFNVGIIRKTIPLYSVQSVKNHLSEIKDSHEGRWHNLVIKTMDFPYCYNSLMQIVDYVPEKVDYLRGSTYSKIFLWPIPRSWWPEKPEGISRVVVRHFYPQMYDRGVSMSPTIVGEAYFNFGTFGIIIVMALFGVICQSLYTFLKKNRKNIGAIAIYASVAPYIFESFRGYFFECTMLYLFYGLCIFIAFYVARLISKKRQKPDSLITSKNPLAE